MPTLHVHLFGKFRAESNGCELENLDACKVQELFSYLLLHRNRPHPREALAALLWGDSSSARSKKYLRQTLWQLQTSLESRLEIAAGQVLAVDPNWVQLNSKADLRLDVAVFEQVFARVGGRPGRELDEQTAQSLQGAVELYSGDLLEGWYQDWCLFERERLQNMYLIMLDKQMAYCEAARQYEAGIAYGARILHYDCAHERTHRRLMRLQYLAGDRTAALRQYERCVSALERELNVRPERRTVTLYEQIRAGRYGEAGASAPARAEAPGAPAVSPSEAHALGHLKQLQTFLSNVQSQVLQDIQALELRLKGR